jgi:glucosyl-dolichyl phosphate glucuronosyltransferase
MSVRVEIAICTWNRSALLARTLEQLAQMRQPDGADWRLLVVNNNSTDDTAGVLQSYADRLPLRSIFEPQPGLSRARNRAISETTGDYLVWTDDDVVVAPEWLEAYVAAFREHPAAAFFGGPVEPWFDGTPPRWLSANLELIADSFALRQFGDSTFCFDQSRVPFGANCAFKTAVQRQYLYNPILGRRPGSNLGGEETEVMRQMMAAGHTGWWVPRAKVRHFIPRERQTTRYVRRIFGGHGELSGLSLNGTEVPRLFGRPRWLWREAILAEGRYRWSRATAASERWLPRLIDAARAWGRLKAAP